MEQENEDPFDQILKIREGFFLQGYQQAQKEAMSAVEAESFKKGFEKGKELALEIGYYTAIVENVRFLMSTLIKNGNRREKIEKKVTDLEKTLINFEVLERSEEEEIKEMLFIRAQMKILCSLFEIKLKNSENND